MGDARERSDSDSAAGRRADAVVDLRGPAVDLADASEAMPILAHWLLNMVTSLAGRAALLADPRIELTDAERRAWLDRIEVQAAEAETALRDLALGADPRLICLRFVPDSSVAGRGAQPG